LVVYIIYISLYIFFETC